MQSTTISFYDLEIVLSKFVYELHHGQTRIRRPDGKPYSDSDRNMMELVRDDLRDVGRLEVVDDRLQFTEDISCYEMHCTVTSWCRGWDDELVVSMVGERSDTQRPAEATPVVVGEGTSSHEIGNQQREGARRTIAELSVAQRAGLRCLIHYHGTPVWRGIGVVTGSISNGDYARAMMAVLGGDDPVSLAESVDDQMKRFVGVRRGAWRVERFITAWHNSLQFLVQRGESETLEFKSTCRYNLFSRKNDKALSYAVVRTVAAFLNSAGGTLVIGLDNNGVPLSDLVEIDGFKDEDKYLLYVVDRVRTVLGRIASIRTSISFMDYSGCRVCVVRCRKSEVPIYAGKSRHEEEYVVRNGPSTVALPTSEAVEYIRDRFSSYWESRAGAVRSMVTE